MGQFLNVSGERISEFWENFYRALSQTVTIDWGRQMKEYTTVEYFLVGDKKPRYVVFVEFSNDKHQQQRVEKRK